MNARSDRYAEQEWRATRPSPQFQRPIPFRTIQQHKRSAFRSFLRLLGIFA